MQTLQTETWGRSLLGILVKPHGVDTLPERQQGAVNVSRLLQPDSSVASSRAALRAGQVTQSQPEHMRMGQN